MSIKKMKKIRLISCLIVGLVMILGLMSNSNPVKAAYNSVIFSQDTNLYLSGLGINVVAKAGSTAAKVTVYSDHIGLDLENGSNITLTGPAAYALQNPVIQTTCGGSQSSVNITSAITRSIDVTPQTPCTVVSGGGSETVISGNVGGGGGGGGGAGDTTPPTNTSVVINANAAKTATANVTLTLAATDATQMIVSENSNFTNGVWVTYATSKPFTLSSSEGTKTVYAAFRDAAGNVSTAVSDTIVYSTTATAAETVTPVVTVATVTVPTAPVTIPTLSVKPTVNEMSAVLSAIMSQVLYIQANLTSPNALTLLQDVLVRVAGLQSAISGPAATTFSKSLYKGIQNSDVTALQSFLKSQGTDIYPEGLVTGYFGSATEKAVQRFQAKYGLSQLGDSAYGFVGPKTRAKINALLGL